MKKYTLIIACLLLTLLMRTVCAATFLVDGSIVNHNAFITMRDDKDIVITNSYGDQYCLHLWFFDKAQHQMSINSGLSQTKLLVDPLHETTILTGAFTTPAHPTPIQLRYGFALQPSGIVHVTLDFITDVPLSTVLSECNLGLTVPRASLAGHTMQADADAYTVRMTTTHNDDHSFFNSLFNTHPYNSVTFFADAPSRQVVFYPRQTQPLRFYNDDRWGVGMIFSPLHNSIAFDVEVNPAKLSASAESYAGIDYWATDKLRIPNFALCRNLIQNPGFEDGLRYWQYFMGGNATELQQTDHYQIDTLCAHSGRCSLKLLGEKNAPCAQIATFGIPLEGGASYILSFYAKADHAGVPLSNWNITGQSNAGSPGSQWYALTTAWKRYAVTFTAPNGLMIFSFGVPGEGVAWLDDVQLEKGTLTDYVEKPAGCRLVTDRRNNLFQPGEQVNARLEIHAPAHAQGTVQISATDFSGTSIRRETRAFTADARGTARLPLTWTEGWPNGLYLIETDIRLADGFADRDFQRLTIMPALTRPYAHRLLFCTIGTDFQDNWTRQFAFWRWIGTGAFIYFAPSSHGFMRTWAHMGGFQFAAIFAGGNKSGEININDTAPAPAFTAEQLRTIEENAYQRAKAYPEIRYWKTINEPDTHLYSDPAMLTGRMLPALAAARRGILRADPQAEMLTPDPCNMAQDDRAGIPFIGTFLAAGGGKLCDIVAIHPYRERPESPDLDADTAALLATCQRNGYHGDIWFTEGIYHQNYIIPAYGLDSLKGCSTDQNWTEAFSSYDLGWGERISAAYAMRSWLVGLKYANRVKIYVNWNFQKVVNMGVDMLPTASAFAVNTLGNLLGNATYRQDITLGENIRCYVFVDENQRPVAALWCCAKEVDCGFRTAPAADFSGLPPALELFDMVGKRQRVGSRHAWTIPSCPIFLRGAPGSLKAFVAKLAQVRINRETGVTVQRNAQTFSPILR